VWCGGQGSIVRATADGDAVLALDSTDGLPFSGISALFLDAESRLWFGTTTKGAGFYDGKGIRTFGESDGLPHRWVTSIGADKHGDLWFGTQHGIVSWNGTGFEPIPTPEEDLRVGIIQFIVQDSSGHLWFGTQRGIYEWDDSLLSHFDAYDGLVSDATRSGYVDQDGNLWVGTVGGVSRVNMTSLSRNMPPPPVEINKTLLTFA
jgi:ligand-binding sensor domain-containing protein